MNKLKQLLTYFMPRKQLTGRVWNMWGHKGWGDRIDWSSFEDRRMDGHTTPHVAVGDEIRSDMESGKVARFAVINVETVRNVPDMWFADVTDLGYVGEPLMNKSYKEAEELKDE